MGTNNELREVMIEVLEYIETFHKYITPGKGKKLTALFAVADTIRDKARAALAAPQRNCDVGTEQEQAVRFDAFVRDRRLDLNCTGKCPAHNGVDFGVVDCVLQWAQMPYEEGGNDGNK